MERTAILLLILALGSYQALGMAAAGSGANTAAGRPVGFAGAPITLAQAQERALQWNPDLAALAAGVRAAEGAARQARALRNPELSVDADGLGGTVPEPAEAQTLYSLEQSLEIGGKRRARLEERRLAGAVAQADAEVMRRDVLTEVRRRFVRLLGAQQRARILEEALQTAEAVRGAVSELVAAGEVSPIEEQKVEADASLARIDLRAAMSELGVLRQEIAEMWGGWSPDFGSAAGELAPPARVPDRGDPEAMIASLPEVIRSRAQVARLEASLDSERRKRAPDLALTAGVTQYRELGDQSFVAGLKIPLPLFDRNAGAIAEAHARLDQGRHERSALEARLVTALSGARERLAAAAEEVTALRETVLPKARQVLESVAEGYRRGKFRLLDLLDARRSLAAAELRYNDALVNLNLAEAEVDRWTGATQDGWTGETR